VLAATPLSALPRGKHAFPGDPESATPLSALPRGRHAFPGDPESAEPANVREAVLHLIEEAARHAGHLDIVRELIGG
jgi:Protein of unknown function (DUF664)